MTRRSKARSVDTQGTALKATFDRMAEDNGNIWDREDRTERRKRLKSIGEILRGDTQGTTLGDHVERGDVQQTQGDASCRNMNSS